MLREFLNEHPTIEIDVCESVLNGGWEALEQNRADLIVGAPGPVPLHKGYRAIPLASAELIPVIASNHELAHIAINAQPFQSHLSNIRRVITHDTSLIGVTRNEGLSSDGKIFYVQNTNQKAEAILAGIGIGHLPRQRIQKALDNGSLIQLKLDKNPLIENFIAWKISNKGKGLKTLAQQLAITLG